ncbi:MAG: hypothetical protein KatS3mg007_1984 [Thermoanaerobaculum sp.]|nr:MAG: hypothetical protein KatS3mg007_1984 [Thermoanaerobaculum sp.]
MEKLPDDRLAESYDLEGVIQAGEATVVFRGRARASGDPVVAKVLRLSGTGVGEVHRLRFLKAVSALIKNAPAGVPPLKDAAWGPEAAVLLFVPVPGTRLTQLTGLTPSQAAHILELAAASVASLHQAAVAHLNLTPDNILVVSADRVYLTGLGWGFLRMPGSGAPFAAPELRKAVDLAEPQRCDVFSLAQIAVELFGAQVVYEDEEARVTLPQPVREKLQNWQELEACLARCLHEDPFERPASVGELRQALAAAVLPGTAEEEGTVRLLPEEEGGVPPQEAGEEAATVILPAEGLPEAGPSEEAAPPEPEPVPASEQPTVLAAPTGEEGAPAPSPEPPPAPAPPEPQVPAPPPPQPAAKPQAAPSRSKLPWVVGAVVGLGLLAGLGLWLFSRAGSVSAPAPTPVPVPTRPTPVPTTAQQPSEASSLLARGELLAAGEQWEELRGLLAGVQEAGLTPEERSKYEALRTRLAAFDQRRALESLRRSLKAGDVSGLRRALRDFEAVKGQEEALSAEDRHLVSQARSINQVMTRLAQEEKAQRWEQVLSEVQNLERLLPGTREAAAAQERAAQALEQQAKVAESQGNYPQALHFLQTLERYLPARPGLAEKIARLREAQGRQEQLRKVLDRAAQLGNEGKPEQGLALLAEVAANGGMAAEVAKLKEKLAAQLAALDSGAPAVAPPAPGYKWEYPKGQVAKVEVKASDDHGVARVTLFFRKKGEKSYRSLPMSKTSAGTYVGEIVPATHGNEDLEFYVLAEDHSGHQGLLASPERPLEVRRKRGLFGL